MLLKTLGTLAIAVSKILGAIVLIVPIITFCLAGLTWLHQTIRMKVSGETSVLTTAIFCGRVSHTRFQPQRHCFSYPLFFCLVDLAEVKKLFKGHLPFMWPLNFLINFRDEDHLKNGEGTQPKLVDDSRSKAGDILSPRIRELVKERTNGKFVPSEDQKILLLTHLSYYGYCFNPVSFYYILKKGASFSGENIEAVVAEVSNTPWNEMKCYVLHPDSEDIMQVKDGRARKHDTETDLNAAKEGALDDATSQGDINKNDWKSINYIFKKKFHVSPFMDMDHIYDWTFWHLTDRIIVSATMEKIAQNTAENDESASKTIKYFNAFFDIYLASFSPFRLCYQLVRFPVYCFIIQIWIHIEAFKLFFKGIEFIPHPEGSETGVSKIIGHVMAPFFAAKDWLANRGSNKNLKVE